MKQWYRRHWWPSERKRVEEHSFERRNVYKSSRRKVMKEEKQMGKSGTKANVSLLFVSFVSGMCECAYVWRSDVVDSQPGALPLLTQGRKCNRTQYFGISKRLSNLQPTLWYAVNPVTDLILWNLFIICAEFGHLLNVEPVATIKWIYKSEGVKSKI